jgi:hypothetical protein
MARAAMRSRLRSREVSTRKQVGDAEDMVNEGSEHVPDRREDQL